MYEVQRVCKTLNGLSTVLVIRGPVYPRANWARNLWSAVERPQTGPSSHNGSSKYWSNLWLWGLRAIRGMLLLCCGVKSMGGALPGLRWSHESCLCCDGKLEGLDNLPGLTLNISFKVPRNSFSPRRGEWWRVWGSKYFSRLQSFFWAPLQHLELIKGCTPKTPPPIRNRKGIFFLNLLSSFFPQTPPATNSYFTMI